jgi:hypothetical protein
MPGLQVIDDQTASGRQNQVRIAGDPSLRLSPCNRGNIGSTGRDSHNNSGMVTPEARARAEIDRLLMAAGAQGCDFRAANLHAAYGVAIREFELKSGHGTADYLLYIDGKAAGVIEAKKHGVALIGVERQCDKYAKGLPTNLPAWAHPLRNRGAKAADSPGTTERYTCR